MSNTSDTNTIFNKIIYCYFTIFTVIEFGSEGICSIPRHILNKDFPLRFKIFVQRVNQNPNELGRGHLNIIRIARAKNLSLTLGIPISGTGIKKGTLNVKAELGCHSCFGREFVQSKCNIDI